MGISPVARYQKQETTPGGERRFKTVAFSITLAFKFPGGPNETLYIPEIDLETGNPIPGWTEQFPDLKKVGTEGSEPFVITSGGNRPPEIRSPTLKDLQRADKVLKAIGFPPKLSI